MFKNCFTVRIIEDQDITGTSKFVFRYMANLTRFGSTSGKCTSNKGCLPSKVCGGTSDGTYCMKKCITFHTICTITCTTTYF